MTNRAVKVSMRAGEQPIDTTLTDLGTTSSGSSECPMEFFAFGVGPHMLVFAVDASVVHDGSDMVAFARQIMETGGAVMVPRRILPALFESSPARPIVFVRTDTSGEFRQTYLPDLPGAQMAFALHLGRMYWPEWETALANAGLAPTIYVSGRGGIA